MSYKGKCNKDGCHSGNLKPLSHPQKAWSLEELGGSNWEMIYRLENEAILPKLMKDYEFKDFTDALDFVNQIAKIAEEMNHHPTIRLEWGKVGVEIWTHAINDLTELDFILAREIDYIK